MTNCFKVRLKERIPFLNGHMRYIKNLQRTRKYPMYPIRTVFRKKNMVMWNDRESNLAGNTYHNQNNDPKNGNTGNRNPYYK